MRTRTLLVLSEALGGELRGDGSATVHGVASLAEATASDLVFVASERYLDEALASAAGCFLIPGELKVDGRNAIAVDNPKLAFSHAVDLLRIPEDVEPGVHPTAVIAESAAIGNGVVIGAHVSIAEDVVIGPRVRIEAGCVIGAGAHVGAGTELRPRVVVYPGTGIGERVLVHAGAVLGCDGFGFVRSPQGLVKFPQIGRLVIEDDVEIGANTTIDRGALGRTIIRRGSKLDNLVQIAHNVDIGEDCALSAQVGIAGSSTLDARVTLGGQVGIGDHVVVGEDVMAGGQAGIPSGKRIPAGQVIWGTPARPLSEVKRQLAHLGNIEKLRADLRDLTARLERLESPDEDP